MPDFWHAIHLYELKVYEQFMMKRDRDTYSQAYLIVINLNLPFT